MAVHLATGSDYLQRTTALLPASGDSTVCFWVNSGAISVGPAYQTGYIILDDPGVYTQYAGLFYYTDGGGHCHLLDVSSSTINTLTPTVSTWTHYAWVQSGTTQRLYTNGTLIGSVTVNRAAYTPGFEFLGNDTFSDGNLSFAYCREWTTALTAAQLLEEMQALTAVHTANLYMDCPFNGTVLDISGNGHDWTTVGSATFVAAPSFPSNHTAATATAFSTLPQTITQDFGDGLYAWYSYTGHANEVIAGFWAYAAIPGDTITTTVYESDATTVFLDMLNIENVPMQVPQTDGTKIYFKVSSATPPSTDVTFSGVAGPTTSVPVGAIFVNDDTTGFATGCVSPVDGVNYQVLQFFDMAITASENGGDVLESGRVLVGNDDSSRYDLYSPQLQLITSVSGTAYATSTAVRTCVGAQVFYAGIGGAGPNSGKMYRIDADGLLTDTWTLPAAGLTGLAASNDESVIYVTGQSSATNAPIKQWNPNTNTFGANLVAGVANYNTIDLIVLGDNSIIAAYHRNSGGGANLFFRRYDVAGATLNTYNFTTTNIEASIFHALDDPASFWVRVHDEVTLNTCTFYNIKSSDGSILSTVTQKTYEGGVFQGTATASPSARFGLSESCPSFILREAITPPAPGDPVTTLIRRERIFRHLSDEQQWIFYQWLQIDVEAGVGLSTGQGSDPQIILQWSDDGGHTWSNEHLLSAGKQGEYGKRAMLKQPLGRSRDRVFKVAMSDPVKWALLNAYFGAEKGPS